MPKIDNTVDKRALKLLIALTDMIRRECSVQKLRNFRTKLCLKKNYGSFKQEEINSKS